MHNTPNGLFMKRKDCSLDVHTINPFAFCTDFHKDELTDISFRNMVNDIPQLAASAIRDGSRAT